MATTKKRINISVPEEVDSALKHLAERDDVPQATEALRIDEDDVFNALAEKRDTKDAKFVSHKDAWE